MWQENSWACIDVIDDYFGESKSLSELTERSQLLQSIGYKAAFEEARRQWKHCSMAVNWCFNEPWTTAANNSIMSYPLVKKPAYYAVRDSLRAVMASAKFEKLCYTGGEELSFELWYINDSDAAVSDVVTACVQAGGREQILLEWQTGEVAAFDVRRGATARVTLPGAWQSGLIKITLKTAGGAADSEYTLLYKKKEDKTVKAKTLNM